MPDLWHEWEAAGSPGWKVCRTCATLIPADMPPQRIQVCRPDPILAERMRCARAICRHCAEGSELTPDRRHVLPTDLGGGTMRLVAILCSAARIWPEEATR